MLGPKDKDATKVRVPRYLGFKELKAMPTGAVLASEKCPALEVLSTSKTTPFREGSSTSWAYTVVVR